MSNMKNSFFNKKQTERETQCLLRLLVARPKNRKELYKKSFNVQLQFLSILQDGGRGKTKQITIKLFRNCQLIVYA